MGVSRRNFLKIAGISLLGLGAKPAYDVFAGRDLPEFAQGEEAREAKRWAMVIDTRKCRDKDGCQDCILACHRAHNVPDVGNSRQEIKWIWTEPYENAFPNQEHEFLEETLKHRPVIVLCNHCDDPPCVRVCPTKATFKREDGIVMMDYHRCIGCRFCMAACPYGSRSFNWGDPRRAPKEKNPDFPTNPNFPTRTKGVVEKCNFCEERLVAGLLPACVEACKEKALIFGDLGNPDSDVRKVLRSHYTIRRKPGLGTGPAIYYIV
nr:4Fe-4S dicluster domain-containing protein [Desulfobacterales bacterium]